MRCPNCETDNNDGTRFCTECGFPLGGGEGHGAKTGGAARPKRPDDLDYGAPLSSAAASPAPSASGSGPLGRDRFDGDGASGSMMRNEASAVRATEFDPWRDGSYPPEAAHPERMARGGEAADVQHTVAFDPLYDDAAPTSSVAAPSSGAAPNSFGTFNSFNSYRGFEGDYQAIDNIDPAGEPRYDDVPAAAPDAPTTIDRGAPRSRMAPRTAEVAPNAADYSFDTIEFDRAPEREAHPAAREEAAAAPPAAASKASQQRRSFKAAPARQGLSGKQRGLVVGGIVVVLAALALVVGFALGLWGGVAVPNVVGMEQAQAQETLTQAGFEVRVLPVKSDETEGRVLVMDPGAGSFAEEGSEVSIHVAQARTIPSIIGQTSDQAAKALEEAGYTNVRFVTQLTDGEENLVLAVSPDVDTRAKSGIEVTVTLSENYKVPDVVSQGESDAQTAVEEAGFTPQVSYVDTTEYPDRTVITTDPAAGTKADSGSVVMLKVARTRGIELESLAKEYLAPGNTVEIAGVSYQVESLDSVAYEGDDTVSYTITAKPFVTFFGETLFASSSQTLNGQIAYNQDNEIIGIG